MPLSDIRTVANAKKGKHSTAGRKVVTYVDAKGETTDALVLGQGTSSGLKLRVFHPKGILDNIPKATNMGSVSCYRVR